MEDLRYPVGKFHSDGPPSPEQQKSFLEEIAQTPAKLRAAVLLSAMMPAWADNSREAAPRCRKLS